MLKDDQNFITAVFGAITTLMGVVFAFVLKSRKQQNKSVNELLEDSSYFRDELRSDLKVVKEERDHFKIKISELESELQKVNQRNIVLTKEVLALRNSITKDGG